MMCSVRWLVCLMLLSYILAAPVPSAIQQAIEPIVKSMASKYNCSVSVAMQGPITSTGTPLAVTAAAGIIDRSSQRTASTTDPYCWGSVTKLVTGTGVLRLVDEGKLSLSSTVTDKIDPMLARMAKSDPTQNFTSMEELWGSEVHSITVKDLLGMTSGVPDFDTASPSGRGHGDFFRAQVYAHPERCYSPAMLIGVPWVRTGKLQFSPGVCDRKKYFNCYSSTNFVLLGLLLAHYAQAPTWSKYHQVDALSKASADFSHLQFAVTGPPNEYTPVKGYDTTHYNNNTGAIDVSAACGVFGGWSASDFVAPASQAAILAQDIYAPQYKLISKPLVDEMYEASSLTGYGLATFNLTYMSGGDIAYGHLGATYGYQSIVVYSPSLHLSIAIGTNIERDSQDQPQDVFCGVYNTAKAILLGKSIPTCTFKRGYWNAGCKCKWES